MISYASLSWFSANFIYKWKTITQKKFSNKKNEKKNSQIKKNEKKNSQMKNWMNCGGKKIHKRIEKIDKFKGKYSFIKGWDIRWEILE